VAAAYDPAAPGFRFRALFLNAVGDPAQQVRPPGVEVSARHPRPPTRFRQLLLRLTVPHHRLTKCRLLRSFRARGRTSATPRQTAALPRFPAEQENIHQQVKKRSNRTQVTLELCILHLNGIAGTLHVDRPCLTLVVCGSGRGQSGSGLEVAFRWG
jgi:hypothetical protein